VPRRPRNFDAGIYHVGSHASDARHLFVADDERALFLKGLGGVLERFDLGLISYTLMGNHYHAVLRIADARLSKALQRLHTWYSRRHNKRQGRSAHLFRAHFFSREIEGDADLLGVCLEQPSPPPRAWNPRGFLELGPIRAAFGAAPNWRRRYRRSSPSLLSCPRSPRSPPPGRPEAS
jgi:hypothetical protein